MHSLRQKRRLFREYSLGRGFFLTDGVRYGLDFLVYTDSPARVHSKYGVLIDTGISHQQLVAYQRICATNNKTFVLARVDEQTGEVAMTEYRRFPLGEAESINTSAESINTKAGSAGDSFEADLRHALP